MQRGVSEPGRGKASGLFWENVAAESEDVGLRVLDPVWGWGESQWQNIKSSSGSVHWDWGKLEPLVLRERCSWGPRMVPFWG